MYLIMVGLMFSEKEIEYLKSQRIARIATTAMPSEGSVEPDVVPVGFDFDGEYFYVGGINILKSRKYKNILKNNKVALVIDDNSISFCQKAACTVFLETALRFFIFTNRTYTWLCGNSSSDLLLWL
jgi:nitroimidazol reductase NimA-like FMN-containing flavoprotein (pyridoxamine 5'-phosphate oxidase superfamily)